MLPYLEEWLQCAPWKWLHICRLSHLLKASSLLVSETSFFCIMNIFLSFSNFLSVWHILDLTGIVCDANNNNFAVFPALMLFVYSNFWIRNSFRFIFTFTSPSNNTASEIVNDKKDHDLSSLRDVMSVYNGPVEPICFPTLCEVSTYPILCCRLWSSRSHDMSSA